MKKRESIPLPSVYAVILTLIFLGCCALFVFREVTRIHTEEFFIFEDISECENIITNRTKDATVELINDPAGDKLYNESFSYTSFWGAEYASDSLNFVIYAYEFDSRETAKAYYEVNSEHNTREESAAITQKICFRGQITVFNDNTAYVIYTRSSKVDEVMEFISNCFSVKVENFFVHAATD